MMFLQVVIDNVGEVFFETKCTAAMLFVNLTV